MVLPEFIALPSSTSDASTTSVENIDRERFAFVRNAPWLPLVRRLLGEDWYADVVFLSFLSSTCVANSVNWFTLVS